LSKREYKKSTRFSTYKEYPKEELDSIIDIIKKTGEIPSGKFVSPSQIEPYLKEHYFKLVEKIDKFNSHHNDILSKMEIDDLKVEFIKLSQPI